MAVDTVDYALWLPVEDQVARGPWEEGSCLAVSQTNQTVNKDKPRYHRSNPRIC